MANHSISFLGWLHGESQGWESLVGCCLWDLTQSDMTKVTQQQQQQQQQGCILSPCLFNLYAEYIIQNARLDETQAGIKTARRYINNFRQADDTTLMTESKEELKSHLMKVKEECGKSQLKTQHSENKDHGIQSHHFMANIWGNNGNSDRVYFIFLGSKITTNGDCSHEIKRFWLLGRKSMTNLNSILKKQKHYFANKVKAMVFPVVMYGCDRWTIKKYECRRIDAVELWF